MAFYAESYTGWMNPLLEELRISLSKSGICNNNNNNYNNYNDNDNDNDNNNDNDNDNDNNNNKDFY